MDRQTKLCFYKPTREVKGAAVQLDLSCDKEAVFLEAANQNGEHAFNWGEKIVVKLDAVDLGKLLAVLAGRAPAAKLFHDPSKREGYAGNVANNTVEFAKGTQYGYFLKVSRQASDKSVKSIALSVSEDEAQLLRVLLERSIARIYGW